MTPELLRLLVVDDEEPARRRLVRLIAEIPGVEVAGEARDGDEALDHIKTSAPDALLLDIHMPGLDGMTIALENRGVIPVVFVTAYDQHAVAAFDADAIDYLVKPVSRARLQEAIGRLRKRRQTAPTANVLRMVSELGQRQEAASACRIAVTQGGTVRLFDARRVGRFWADERYTVFRADGEEFLSDEPLNALEERLGPHRFLRVHRGELINLDMVVALHNDDGIAEVELDDGQRARVSRRQVGALRRALGLSS